MARTLFPPTLVCIALLLAALQPLRAQEPPPETTLNLTLEQAIALATEWLEQGKIEPAGRLIRKLRAAPDPPEQVLFLSGHLKLRTGDVPGAIEEFREILRRDPKAVRVRLDLALALYRARDYQAALYHFELALSADLPPQAKANALRFVRDIRQRQSYWEFSAGLTSDTNINYATRATEVPIGEARFILSEDARAKPGTGLLLTLSGRESFGPGLDNFVNVYLEDTNYAAGRFDLFYGAVTLGHTFSYASHDVSVEGGGHYANWGEHTLYRGLLAKIADNWRLRPDTLFTPSFEARELRYPSFPFLTGNQYTANMDLARALFGNSTVRAGTSAIRQHAQQKSAEYHAYGVRLEAQTELPRSFTVGMHWESFRFRYDAPDPIFGADRHDRRSLVELSLLRRDLHWLGFSPRLTVGYNRGTSTLPLYEFDRKYLRITITRQF